MIPNLKQVGHIIQEPSKDSPKSKARGLNKMHDFAFKTKRHNEENEQEGWRQNTLKI